MSIITLSLRTKNSRFRIYFALLLLLQFPLALPAAQRDARSGETLDPFLNARRTMIERDLKSRGIKDPRSARRDGVRATPSIRPEKFRSSAYDDRPLPIGEAKRFLSPISSPT
jgi:hypothetical protein